MPRKVSLAVLSLAVTGLGFAQSGSMNVVDGLNTVEYKLNATATPDPTIAVGTIEFCEHVNSAYQCWYKSGSNALQPVTFFGNTNPKSDIQPWSQHSYNSGNTTQCASAATPNAQLLHDNVYNRWIMQKRITSAATGHNYMCVAISNNEDVSHAGFNWFAFQFDLDTVIPLNSKGNYYYPDYPQAGLWQTSTSTAPPYAPGSDQAMWITYDLQDPNNGFNIMGVLVCAVDLAGLRDSTINPWVNKSHTPACTVAHPLTTFNQRRSWVPASNSDTVPPIAGDGEMFTYMIEAEHNRDGFYLTSTSATQGVEQWTIDWAATTPTPSFVNSWDLPSTEAGGDQLACFNFANYYFTQCIPQPSTATTGITIDSVGDRMQQPFHYTSNGGLGGIWTSAHAIQIAPNATDFTQTEADVRVLGWNTAAPKAIIVALDLQLTDPLDPDAYVFLPSVARDKAGNLQGIIGLSGTGASEHPGLDGVYFIPGTTAAGSYGYIADPATDGDAEDTDPQNYRWGDWQGAELDPSDSCTIWVVGEYLPVNRTTEPFWYTQIAQLPPANNCLASGYTLTP
jgi:hypothetical protein